MMNNHQPEEKKETIEEKEDKKNEPVEVEEEDLESSDEEQEIAQDDTEQEEEKEEEGKGSGKGKGKDFLKEIVDTAVDNLARDINSRLKTDFAVDDIKLLLQSFYNKVIDRLEDPRGIYAYKQQSSFFKGLIGIYDLLKELENNPWQEGEDVHVKNYKAIGKQLVQVFLMHDLNPVSPCPGEPFDPRLHRAVGLEETANPEENSTVSQCTRVGFVFHEVVVRPAEVKIKKYIKPKEEDKKLGSEEVRK